jgi:hypothetical protein
MQEERSCGRGKQLCVLTYLALAPKRRSLAFYLAATGYLLNETNSDSSFSASPDWNGTGDVEVAKGIDAKLDDPVRNDGRGSN